MSIRVILYPSVLALLDTSPAGDHTGDTSGDRQMTLRGQTGDIGDNRQVTLGVKTGDFGRTDRSD